jgi:hypothetical protein
MSSTMAHGDDDPRGYVVGYGKPPQHSRFQKGRSGNPSGRPRSEILGATSLAQLLQAALDETVLVPKGRRRRRVTKREAIVANLVDRALQSDPRAIRLLFDTLPKTQHASFASSTRDDGEDPRERLIREFDRLAAEQEQKKATALGQIPGAKASADETR